MLDRLKADPDAEAVGLHQLDHTNREALTPQCLRLQYHELETPSLRFFDDAVNGCPMPMNTRI